MSASHRHDRPSHGQVAQAVTPGTSTAGYPASLPAVLAAGNAEAQHAALHGPDWLAWDVAEGIAPTSNLHVLALVGDAAGAAPGPATGFSLPASTADNSVMLRRFARSKGPADPGDTVGDARREAGERIEEQVIGINRVDIIEAQLDGSMARITVEIESEQVNVTYDSAGEVIEGDPNKVVKLTDIWTFERDVRSDDPTWKLVDTAEPE